MSEDGKNPLIALQPLCALHQSTLIHGVMHMQESDPWRVAIMTCNILLFQAMSADERVHARAENKAENLSLVMAELGPPCCAIRNSVLARVFLVMAKGLSHASQVAQGKLKDPDFDMLQLKHTLRKSVKP